MAVAIWQIRSIRSTQREATVSVKFRDYLCLALEHPDLACPDIHELNIEMRTFDGNRMKFEEYEWFVAIVQHVMAEIANTTSNKKTLIRFALGHHKTYLSSAYYKATYKSDDFNPRMSELLEQVMGEG